MISTLCDLLNRATRAKEVIVNTKQKHKDFTQKIKEQRNQLMIEMTHEVDGSVAQCEIERQIDLLDKKEIELHRNFKKILSTADTEINEIINEITREFGPGWNSNNPTEDAQLDERGAAKEIS